MTSLLLLLGAQVAGPALQDAPQYFKKEVLGEEGLLTFEAPDKVTFQRAYTAQSESLVSIQAHCLTGVGDPLPVPDAWISGIKAALLRPEKKALNLCYFHADHVLTFFRGKSRLDIATCFSCSLIRVSLDSKMIGGTVMPWGQPFGDLPGLIPTEVELNAVWDESAGNGFYNRLVGSKRAFVERVENAASAKDYQELKVGSRTALSSGQLEKIRTVILTSPLLQKSSGNTFGLAGRELPYDLLLTFESDPPVRFLVRKEDYRTDGITGALGLRQTARDLLLEDFRSLEGDKRDE